MFYDDEELLEAVDILIEDYGYDEDEAIDLLMEDYEDELLEEVEFLIENYGFDEDEAIDLIIENFKFSRDKQNTTTVEYKGANPDGRGLLTKENKFTVHRQTGKPTISNKNGIESINKGMQTGKEMGKIFRNSANTLLGKELADHDNKDRIFLPTNKEKSVIRLAKHMKVDNKYKEEDLNSAKRFQDRYNAGVPEGGLKSTIYDRKKKSYDNAEKIYNAHKAQDRTTKSGNSKLNSKAKIVGGTALAAAGGAYLTHKAYKKHKENKKLKNRIKRKLGIR